MHVGHSEKFRLRFTIYRNPSTFVTSYNITMLELIITCVTMYILYLFCEIKYMVVKIGSLVVRHDKQERAPPKLEWGGEMPRLVTSPKPLLSFSSGCNTQKKDQNKKKSTQNKKNKKNNDQPPAMSTSNEKGIPELKEEFSKLLNSF